jgi:hypothetical protein
LTETSTIGGLDYPFAASVFVAFALALDFAAFDGDDMGEISP